ncbi:hypothetical protein ACFCXR_39715 [Streptomyces noursei]|uniref:hypothetical protein n=1 Tax=Streptomyces noursei TaxID=1971 RepID=UPI0035D888B8
MRKMRLAVRWRVVVAIRLGPALEIVLDAVARLARTVENPLLPNTESGPVAA